MNDIALANGIQALPSAITASGQRSALILFAIDVIGKEFDIRWEALSAVKKHGFPLAHRRDGK